jgi:hypothetical protein
MVSEGQAGQSGQHDAQKAVCSPQDGKNCNPPASPGHESSLRQGAKHEPETGVPTPNAPEARPVHATTKPPFAQPPAGKNECHCPVIATVIVAILAFYVIAGWLERRWVARDRSWKKLAIVAFLVLIALPVSYGITQWPFYLAAELSVVLLGVTAGWCWIDYDRRKINGPGLRIKGDLDQLGYFNSRVAMRSAELFNTTVLDIPVGPGEQPERDIAHLLVQNYWGIPLGIAKCVATPNNVTVYFSQPAYESEPPEAETRPGFPQAEPLMPEIFLRDNYKLEKEKEAKKGKENAGDAGVEAEDGEKPARGKKADGDKEYETVEITGVVRGPIRRAVVLNLKSPLSDGAQLRLTVSNLKFRVNAGDEGVEMLAPNNICSFKVSDKSIADGGENLKRVLQPAYAIGMGIITDDQYNTLKNEFFAQSELSLGLIVPLILVVLGLALIPQIGLGPTGAGGELTLHAMAWFFICASLAPISMGLFVVGAERFHKFRMEVKLLILGNWQKQTDAAKKQDKKDQEKKGKDDNSPTAIQDALAKALTSARNTTLKIDVDAKS